MFVRLFLFQGKLQIAIDLSKQHALGADPRAISQINVTPNLDTESRMSFIIEQARETVFEFS